MVLAPLDSRNFLYQDLLGRSPQGVDYTAVCTALLTLFDVNSLGLVVQPRPTLGKVDLASVFFDRVQLAQENIFFSESFFSLSPYSSLHNSRVAFLCD